MKLAAVIVLALTLASPSIAGPITAEDYREYSCMTVGVRGTNQRHYDCSPRRVCYEHERQVRKHSKLRVIASCEVTAPLWCFELAPRNGFGPFTICQPTLAACRRERARELHDAGKGDASDTKCAKTTSVPTPQSVLDLNGCLGSALGCREAR
jgi:hypothetical protein